MPGDLLLKKPRLTMAQFHALRDERSKEERWELIDGVPMMMVPPTLVHQRISRNLATLINTRLQRVRSDWQADMEIGIWLEGDERFNPEPDVTVIDTAIKEDQVYAERFYFVAEVRSKSDSDDVLDAKLTFYMGHEHNLGVMFVRQDRFNVELHVRGTSGWEKRIHKMVDEVIDLPVIGPIGRVGDHFRHTPLDPFGGA